MKQRTKFIDHLLKIKKARLIEHNLNYEDLMSTEIFSDDEQTLQYKVQRVKQLQEIKAIKKVKKL
jgi:hypothetical protein